jgi:hypothetical protein
LPAYQTFREILSLLIKRQNFFNDVYATKK